MATRDWSRLPPDLLGEIINCLPIPCCIRARAVCRSWSLAAAETPYCPINPQSPWLIATQRRGDTPPPPPPHMYDLSERRLYHLIGISGMARCFAFSHGWLVFVDKVSELHLLNPITGVRIPLPSITTFPDIIRAERDSLDGRIIGYVHQPPQSDRDSEVIYHQHMMGYYLKIKVFTDRHSKNVMVFVLRGHGLSSIRDRLSYANDGDETWTEIWPESNIFRGMADFAFHMGKLYGVVPDGRLVVVDNLTSPLENLRYINSRWPDIFRGVYFVKEILYLVDSVDGKDLLLVIRDHVILDQSPVQTSSFLVLKLDLDSESGWILVRRLERETAIILGEESSMVLSTHGLPEIKENCIYFTDINTNVRTRGGDEGIFHLEDQTISPLVPDHDPFLLPLRNWFIPAL